MGRNMIKTKRQDSVQGRDCERLVVGGGGQSKPGEVIEYSCANCYKVLPNMQCRCLPNTSRSATISVRRRQGWLEE